LVDVFENANDQPINMNSQKKKRKRLK